MSQLSTVTKSHASGVKSCEYARTVYNLEALVLRRIRALYEKVGTSGDKWTAEKLMPFLGMTDPSGVRKLLNGDNRISLAHLQGFCEAFGVLPSDIVAPEGATAVYLKESEPVLLKLFREMDAHERHSLLVVLQRQNAYVPMHKSQRRRARPGHAELTAEQQQLVEYFQLSDPSAREGVLKILRGTAKREARTRHTVE